MQAASLVPGEGILLGGTLDRSNSSRGRSRSLSAKPQQLASLQGRAARLDQWSEQVALQAVRDGIQGDGFARSSERLRGKQPLNTGSRILSSGHERSAFTTALALADLQHREMLGSGATRRSGSSAGGMMESTNSDRFDGSEAAVAVDSSSVRHHHAEPIVATTLNQWRASLDHAFKSAGAEATHPSTVLAPHGIEMDDLWLTIRSEARLASEEEPALASYLYSTVLAHRSLERSLAFHLANKLGSSTLLSSQLFSLIADTLMEDADIREALRADLRAIMVRDPACETYVECLLNYKGFLACETQRVAHSLWTKGRTGLALALQSRVSEVFHVDIHPAAKIGKGVMFDHATGLVIGETAEIGNNVSILHHVTLGGTGAVRGQRHPVVGDGVLIGAGATLLGAIVVGAGAKIGAGSLVLMDVPPHTTAVGNPARLMGGKKNPVQSKEAPSSTMDQTSFLSQWSDYII